MITSQGRPGAHGLGGAGNTGRGGTWAVGGLPRLGNVVVQCPACRSWDVTKSWNFTNPYYQCGNCGLVWS